MDEIELVIVGYGNVGRGVHGAIRANPDMELAGILTRGPDRVRSEFNRRGEPCPPLMDAGKDRDFSAELVADAAVLCGGSKEDLPKQGPQFARHYNTVDSFDTHADIPEYFGTMDEVGREHGTLSVVSTGWDPGTFSEERVKADAFLPGASHYTFWGPGVSQGHSDAVRQIDGVVDCRQYTLPVEDAIQRVRSGERPGLEPGEMHTREAYVVVEEGADRDRIRREIKQMPHYFEPYKTTVQFVSREEMEAEHDRYPHGGFVMASGESAAGNSALIEYSVEWDSNPEATGQIMVAHARAAVRMYRRGETGARTVLDVPPIDLSPHSREELLADYL